jgi:hypothetical protein
MVDWERLAVAYHEAGHAVVAHAVGFTVDEIELRPDNTGRVHFTYTEWPGVTSSLLRVYMAGRLGEIRGLGECAGRSDGDDLRIYGLLAGTPLGEWEGVRRDARVRAGLLLGLEKSLFETLAEYLYRGVPWRNAFTDCPIIRMPCNIENDCREEACDLADKVEGLAGTLRDMSDEGLCALREEITEIARSPDSTPEQETYATVVGGALDQMSNGYNPEPLLMSLLGMVER